MNKKTKQTELSQRIINTSVEAVQTILETIPDMMFVLNDKGEYLDLYAPQTEKLLIPKEKLVGKHMKDVLPPKVYKKLKSAIDKAKEKKELQVMEYTLEQENGLNYYEARIVHFDDSKFLAIVRDITEQRETERKLKVKESQNKAILKTLPDLMILYDKHGNHLKVHAPDNSQLLAPYNDHIGQNIDTILPKDVSEKIKMVFANCIKTDETQTVEYTLIIMEALRYFETRIAQTDTGNFLAIIRDITERKEAERKLKENEERLRFSLEAGEFSSWDWNLQTNNIFRDKNANSLFGSAFEKQTSTFDSFMDMVHPDDKADLKLAISKALKMESSLTKEYRIMLPDKSIRWLRVKGKIFKDTNGKPERIIGVTHNISEQKIAEQKLKESEEKLRDYAEELEKKVEGRTKELTTTIQKLVESNLQLEDQILITKEAENIASTNRQLLNNVARNFPRGSIVVVNDDFTIEFSEGEALDEMGMKGLVNTGTAIDDIDEFSENLKTRLKDNIRRTLKGEHLSFETKFNGHDYLLNTTPLYNNNKATKALFVYNGISEQKQVETNILNTLKREQELSELKSRFISMASHEFRTPLTAINSSAILIGKQNGTGKEEKRERYVSQIKKNVNNLVVILNDFLSLSKLQEGKIVAQPVSLDLVEFSKSIIEEIEGNKKVGQTINFINNQSHQNVFLDSKLFRHIISNLLSNAIKYSEENKEITYKLDNNDTHVCIEIIDTGIGIPEADKNSMFQRFYRANNVSNIEGTGLGLNIVKQYTELMGGAISFKSELNIGTTFFIEFPLKLKE